MNKEENTNHILIEVLNNNGDLKLTKFRNPQAIWQNYDYPDEYVFRDVDIINVFNLIQENKQLKERIDKATEYIGEVLESWEKEREYHLVFNIAGLLNILKGEDNE